MTPGLVPQPEPPVEDSSSSESDSSQSSTSSSAIPIKGKGSIPLMQVPKKYLQGVVKAMAPALTHLCTLEWQVADLVRMIWILARVRPQAQMSAFKSKTYGALNRAFHDRAQEVRANASAAQLDQDIKAAIIFDEDILKARAAAHGFKDEWLQKPAAKARSKQSAALPDSVQRFTMRQLTHIEGESCTGVNKFSDARSSGDALAPPQGSLEQIARARACGKCVGT